jgi:hypothetical protein
MHAGGIANEHTECIHITNAVIPFQACLYLQVSVPAMRAFRRFSHDNALPGCKTENCLAILKLLQTPIAVIKLLAKLALPLCAFSVILFSCSSSDDDPKPANVSVTFLKVGTKYTMYCSDGFFLDDTVKTFVDSQIGVDTFLVRNYSETIAVPPTQYWVLHDNNFYTSYRLRDADMYQIECKFGQPVGTSWKVVKNRVQYTYSIEALDVSVTTGDGVVNDAIKIKVKTASGPEAYQYISPTVGMLGNGSVDDESAIAKVIHYTVGTTSSPNIHVPAISYGDFPFLTVGKYWKYTEYDFGGNEIAVELKIDSKLPGKNIYKAKLTYDGDVSYSYWYEDRGLLMVYEEGESVEQGDPVYEDAAQAEVGHGWVGLASTGTIFIYKVTALDETMDTYFGELPCMAIEVGNGLFSMQTNYWNQSKGNVLVSGFVSREVNASNARGRTLPFIPVISI